MEHILPVRGQTRCGGGEGSIQMSVQLLNDRLANDGFKLASDEVVALEGLQESGQFCA